MNRMLIYEYCIGAPFICQVEPGGRHSPPEVDIDLGAKYTACARKPDISRNSYADVMVLSRGPLCGPQEQGSIGQPRRGLESSL